MSSSSRWIAERDDLRAGPVEDDRRVELRPEAAAVRAVAGARVAHRADDERARLLDLAREAVGERRLGSAASAARRCRTAPRPRGSAACARRRPRAAGSARRRRCAPARSSRRASPTRPRASSRGRGRARSRRRSRRRARRHSATSSPSCASSSSGYGSRHCARWNGSSFGACTQVFSPSPRAERDQVEPLGVGPRRAVEALDDAAHPTQLLAPRASVGVDDRDSSCSRGTDCARSSSVGSSAASVFVQSARPARKPARRLGTRPRPPPGTRRAATPCERTTHGTGSASSISRQRA